MADQNGQIVPMPTSPEFQRTAEIEREIELLVERIVQAHIQGEDTMPLHYRLNQLSRQLALLRTPSIGVAA